jgi:preprotein translocase subunit SecF
MGFIGRLTRGETAFDFVGLRRRWFTLSGVLILVSLVGLGVRGLNLGLEFEGGVLVQAPNPAGASIETVRSAVEQVAPSDSRVQMIDEGAAVRVQTGPLDADAQDRLIDSVVGVTGADREDVTLETVGPTFGALVARRALLALAVFLGAAALFISWRLQWRMALAGLAALLHDVVLTVGVYSLTGFEVSPATVVALLTILGYSLYDTVVVFDRVQELEEHTVGIPYGQVVNRAMNQVLARSLATSLTSLLPVGSILFVGAFILGATTLRDFAVALFVGIGAGTYSSLFLAGPLLAAWKRTEEPPPRKQPTEQRESRTRPAASTAPAPARPPKRRRR